MKTFLECVKEAAIKEGFPTVQYFLELQHEDAMEVFSLAADIYASQINSHKHGVSGSVCEHTHVLWINSDWKYFCLDCGKVNITN